MEPGQHQYNGQEAADEEVDSGGESEASGVPDRPVRKRGRRHAEQGSKVSRRVRKYRAALRKAGLRPVQIWVPDTRRKGFAAECARQSELLHDDVQEQETLDWIAEVADDDGWTE